MKILQPPAWARPRGYANGIEADGRLVMVAGQVGWNPETGEFETDDFAGQCRRTFENIVAVLAEAGAGPEHLVRLTWYVTSKDEYLSSLEAVGVAYREVIGRHYPAMAAIEIGALIESRAKVEIEATAVVPRD